MRVFTDDFSGGGDFWARPGLRSLLEFLETTDEEHAVIFDDIKRFARDTVFHLKLRKELSARNAYPRCPTFRFEDTPEGEFVETVIAATAELERKQNRRQVIRRMKARLEAGYWTFCPPLGYRYEKRAGQKLLVPDEPSATHVKAALEGFATGELSRQSDVARYLQAKKCYTKWSRGSTISIQKIERLLRNELYSGWCHCQKWNIRARGQHAPLISETVHQKIINRLERKSSPVPISRRTVRPDFPLRGHVVCRHCQRQITSYWAQGRSEKYPYYGCATPGCVNLRAERMTDQFLERLEEARPASGGYQLLYEVLLDSQSQSAGQREQARVAQQSRLDELEGEIAALVDSATSATSARIRVLYEEKLEALLKEQEHLKAELLLRPDGVPIEPALEEAREMLEDPVSYWREGTLKRRRRVQYLGFKQPIFYDRELAYRTADFSLIYGLFGASKGSNSRLVELVKADLNRVAEELTSWEKVLKTGCPAA